MVKDLKDLWKPAKQTRDQNGRLALAYFSTQGGEACGFELLYVIERVAPHEVNMDALVEASLPSTLVKVLHLLFAVPFTVLDGSGGIVTERLFGVVSLLAAHPSVVEELVKTDTLHLLIAVTTIECSLQHRKLRDRVTSLVLLIVKQHTSSNTATYLSNKVFVRRYYLQIQKKPKSPIKR